MIRSDFFLRVSSKESITLGRGGFLTISSTQIDETIFAPLYSSKTNSRPNAPINVLVGAMILKELNGLTDDEVIDECEFDYRFQFALHTTSFEEQPVSVVPLAASVKESRLMN